MKCPAISTLFILIAIVVVAMLYLYPNFPPQLAEGFTSSTPPTPPSQTHPQVPTTATQPPNNIGVNPTTQSATLPPTGGGGVGNQQMLGNAPGSSVSNSVMQSFGKP